MLHVTEALTAGVLTVIETLVREQVRDGAEVAVAYVRRKETLPHEQLVDRLPASVELLQLRGTGPTAYCRLGMHARLAAKRGTIVHAHSAIAGAVARVFTPRRDATFYSPHAYPFLRRDLAPGLQWAFKLAERLLATRGVTLAVSPSEARLARGLSPRAHVGLLENRLGADRFIQPTPPSSSLVVGVGRDAPQKRVDLFEAVAANLPDVRFVWVGASRSPSTENIEFIPWLSPEQLTTRLRSATAFLSTSAWEGLPMVLLEAQAMGVPAIVSDIPGHSDVIEHGTNGYLCGDTKQFVAAIDRIVTSPEVRASMSTASFEGAKTRFHAAGLGAESLELYRSFAARIEGAA